MSGIELNKIAAAILLAGLIAMVAGTVADGLYHSEEKAEKRGYTIAGAEEAAAPTGATAVEEKPVDIAPLLAKADVAKGEATHKKCVACHSFDKGGKNGVGPNMYGIVGNHKAHLDDYKYSDALASRKTEKWDFQNLSEFLHNPKKYAPGTKMGFAGIKNDQERADLIAYLNSLSDSPLPLPK